jgi:hypothetical protein
MSIGLKLIHVTDIDNCTIPRNILVQQTNLVEYFIEKEKGLPIGKKDRLFYSEDPEFKRFTRKNCWGITLRYIRVEQLKDIPEELLKGKNEKDARLAIKYLLSQKGYIILYFT